MIKIALTGRMRSGKSTVAAYLCENYRFSEFAFADALKDIAHIIFGKPSEKDRGLYQFVGQKMREYDPDVWVKKLDHSIKDWLLRDHQRGNIVITDLRQPNEYEYCRNYGYVIIRVNCPDTVRLDRIRESGDKFDEDMLNHETEKYVDAFEVDYETDNGGTWRGMAEQVDYIIRDIKLKER
ncbi:AAA family ATPase [Melghirimyces algeriensis]|uniref:Dephospho-CoA kinase n=1 Tax=Melghirimyces algeriensis TaxID=910412 RepID=A0A521F7G6_9BACL|nr:AAA family ATPase [Melghirimyces algeriensis]SMO92036.1 Dephospho-CoA kinase [Melghirimyces algeriensis]